MKGKMSDLMKTYRKMGIKKGDVVFVHANLLSFGLVSKDKKKFVEIFLGPLLQAVGKSGTIAALSYTFSYSSDGVPYIHEKSPSEAGMFTEHVRLMKGSRRSFHPVCSVVAYGADAREITSSITRSAFGVGSPFSRLHALKAKCLYLGMRCRESCSFLHHVEQLYGVPHCYSKAFFHPAYKNGTLHEGPFLAFLRNRKSEPYNFTQFEKEMKKNGLIKEHVYRNAPMQLINLEDCFRIGMKMLDRNPSAFLGKPFYITE